ncbi:TMV resistance protein N [Linum grandiflorum]
MAASSSSLASSVPLMSPLPPSHSHPYTGEWGYDVFLCFRGDDTRHSFTSHLMAVLSDRQIRTFIDDKLEKTESIDELICILQRCALSVVVFSEKFADSSWFLDEVTTIARRMTECGHRVLPVLYKVDPPDMTNDSRSYATTFNREYDSISSYSEDKKRWMDALKNVTNSAGHTSQSIKIGSELIKVVVEDVQKQLIDMSPTRKSANLVGMSSRILEVERLLDMDTLDDTHIIRVFIVLDDVETPSQLEQILLEEVARNLDNCFGSGSKIIVTTRDKRVLDYAKAMTYTVTDLGDSESVQLFSLRAFRKHRPPRDWEAMSRLATSY